VVSFCSFLVHIFLWQFDTFFCKSPFFGHFSQLSDTPAACFCPLPPPLCFCVSLYLTLFLVLFSFFFLRPFFPSSGSGDECSNFFSAVGLPQFTDPPILSYSLSYPSSLPLFFLDRVLRRPQIPTFFSATEENRYLLTMTPSLPAVFVRGDWVLSSSSFPFWYPSASSPLSAEGVSTEIFLSFCSRDLRLLLLLPSLTRPCLFPPSLLTFACHTIFVFKVGEPVHPRTYLLSIFSPILRSPPGFPASTLSFRAIRSRFLS